MIPRSVDRPNLRIVDALERFYGVLPQPPDDPFGAYVWEVFGVQNTPARREAAVAALRRIPALTPDALARVPQAKLEAVLSLAGPLPEERHRALRAGLDVFRRDPGLVGAMRGPLRQAVRAARALPHLGRASARRVLLFGAQQPVAAADEPTIRVLARSSGSDPLKYSPAAVRRTLRDAAGRDVASLARVCLYLSHHGLCTCIAVAPHCGVCPIRPTCAQAGGPASA